MSDDLIQYETFLNNVRIPLRLACTTKTGWPMVVSLWYLYDAGNLICATQRSARVVSYLRQNPQCAFEISSEIPPYCGLRGQAIATMDHKNGPIILEQLLLRYFGNLDSDLAKKLLAKRETEVALVLNPRRVFSWDFSSRMADIGFARQTEKICP